MKKQITTNAIGYLACMVAACLLNLAVSTLLVKIVNLFIVVEYFEAAIVKLISGFLSCGAVLGAMTFRMGYKSVQFRPLSLLASLVLAALMHLVLCLVLMFHPFISGGVRELAGVLAMGDAFDGADMIGEIYLWTYLAAFWIDFAVQAVVALLCGFLGKRTRLKGRETLRGYGQEKKDENF